MELVYILAMFVSARSDEHVEHLFLNPFLLTITPLSFLPARVAYLNVLCG